MKPKKTVYKVLHCSNWTNSQTGEVNTSWTVVGHAMWSRDGAGITVWIRNGLSVTGKLVIKEDDQPPPSANQPFPPVSNIPNDDTPF